MRGVVVDNALGIDVAVPHDVTVLPLAPTIRMISAADAARVEQFGAGLSPKSRYQRFFSARSFLPGEVHRLTDLDPQREVALVATSIVNGEQHIVAVARYVIDMLEHSAELAIVVADDWQKRGLGRTLLVQLLEHAGQNGIRTIKGLVLASNLGMQHLAQSMGFSLTRVAGDSTVLQIRKLLAVEH